MNKYQEALNKVKEMIYAITDEFLKELNVLQELVDKETPHTPQVEGDGYSDGVLVYDTWYCPRCETKYEIEEFNYEYCPKCGQHIDWDYEEEYEDECED